MIPVYRAGRQLIKVRAFLILSLIVLPLSLWWGFETARTHGLSPGDGGVLAPLPHRLAWGGLVALLGVGFVLGMGFYGRHYAARIELCPESKRIHLDTVAFLGSTRHVIDVADFGNGVAHRDVNDGVVIAAIIVGHPTVPVDAPWTSVRIAGWRWPLIIDHQGLVLHRQLMRILFGIRAASAP